MTIYLGDLNTRARGLATRLLRPEELNRVARATSLFTLRRELAALGVGRAEGPSTPESLEQAVRQRAAGLMAILGRWCGDERRPILAVLMEDEDRRSLQTLLRGAEHGVGSEARMSGLVPTTELSERALRVLASQPTMTDIVRMLVLWSHPFGRPLMEAVSPSKPSLLEVEVALQRAFAARALTSASRAGAHLLAYARQVVDLMNAWSALLHFPERDPAIVDLAFVEGGRWIDRDAFTHILSLERLEDARLAVARQLQDSAIGTAFAEDARDLSELESAVLQAQIVEQSRAARVAPDGSATLIRFALQVRAEVLNLRRIVWGVALHAPAVLLEASMVTG